MVHAGVALEAALDAAARAPADAIGRRDLGRIVPGASADLVALSPGLEVLSAWRAGAPFA